MAEQAKYKFKTINLERNPTTMLLMSICRELHISTKELEELILSEYDSDWEARDKTYLYLSVPLIKEPTSSPALKVNLTLRYDWIQEREPIVFGKWYDVKKAEELIKAWDLDIVDVLCTTEYSAGYTGNSLNEPLSRNCDVYQVTFYDIDREEWKDTVPTKVMFFKAPTE